ncbi:hypothetical protein OROGR_000765 [Orobanche gracilis]
MAVAMARALSLSSLRLAFNLPYRRLLSSSSSSSVILARRPSPAPPSPASWFTAIRCHSALVSESSSSISENQLTLEMMFPGCNFEHWFVVMDKPGGEGATKQKMIDCYIQTLAKVVGSEEEAKKKIINISCELYFGFGCKIDEETSDKLKGLPGVLFVLPDSYIDPEYKDYGGSYESMICGELFVNGEVIPMTPERQKRLELIRKKARERDEMLEREESEREEMEEREESEREEMEESEERDKERAR